MSRHAYACSENDLLRSLLSSPQGLTAEEAARRLQHYGDNQLHRAAGPSALKVLIDQLRSLVVALLVAAACLSFAFGERIEAGAIAAVLVINTAIGFVVEWRARRAMASLLRLDAPQAVVLRDGRLQRITSKNLVPGDVVEIGAGRHVPADGRILSAAMAQVDEAALTGESMPAAKQSGTLPPHTPLADRENMVHKGTTLVSGLVRAVVTATGMRTEIGQIGTLVEGVRQDRTPLERRLEELGRRLAVIALAIAGVVAVLGLRAGHDIVLVGESAIALAVSAVPESLPAVVTIALAVGMHRMARRNAIVRSLPSVESLGSVTVVCTDKTRTLTSGEMRIDQIWAGAIEHVGAPCGSLPSAALHTLEAAVFASRPQPDHGGDPIDRAVLRCGERFGLNIDALRSASPVVTEWPFSSDLKLQALFHRVDGVLSAFVKGAPRTVLARCATNHDGRPLTRDGAAQLLATNDAMAAAGLRVLAVAAGPVAADEDLQGLTFKGFLGLIDPPAPGVKETIAKLRAAGLRTVMLTGDQHLTAHAIGKELGLLDADSELLDGRELLSMHRDELTARAGQIAAYCRVTPADKLAIVQALQQRGEIVAMLGDGVNDAAALRQADVGVSMGVRGTDVAKEAAAIVLQDDRFETVAVAVEEGRIIFGNIRKSVFYLFSCNVAEVFVVLIAGIAGWPMPILPLQLLWVNIVTDSFPALALAMEPGSSRVMLRPPRDPNDAVLSRRFLIGIGFYATVITVSTLGAFWWVHALAPGHGPTAVFMTLGMSQAFHLVNARQRSAVTGLAHFSNPYAIASVLIAVMLQVWPAFWPPLGALLHVSPLSANEWFVIAVASITPAVTGQALRTIRAQRRSRTSPPQRGG